jgi:predicted Rossmann fold flavoprotein
LRGVSNYSVVSYKKTNFSENILFTHKGVSGPAILQISSYIHPIENATIMIDLLPKINLETIFMQNKNNKQTPANYLKNYLTNRLVDNVATDNSNFHESITDLSKDKLSLIAKSINAFKVPISGSEGYFKAEVTAGGIDTNELSSKTMMCKKVPGLFFIGEVVDVTGWLGGYNFQWAWSSGFAAGNAV